MSIKLKYLAIKNKIIIPAHYISRCLQKTLLKKYDRGKEGSKKNSICFDLTSSPCFKDHVMYNW